MDALLCQRKAPDTLHNAAASAKQHQVIINGAAKEIGRAAVIAVTRARGMEVAGAVDNYYIVEDIEKVCAMEEALEIPIVNLTVYDNVKQAAITASFHYHNVEIVESRPTARVSQWSSSAQYGPSRPSL